MRKEKCPIENKDSKQVELETVYDSIKKLDDIGKMYIAGAVAALTSMYPANDQSG